MKRKCYLYVFEGMADWEYGYVVAELNSGDNMKDKSLSMDVLTISASKGYVRSMGGLKIKVEKDFNEIEFTERDILIIVGGNSDYWKENNNSILFESLGSILEKGSLVAAICGGSLALANYGYLDNYLHTSNNLDYLKIFSENYKGEKNFVNKNAVRDRNLITASGVAPLDFAYEIMKYTDLYDDNTLENWYLLNKTQEDKYFYNLMKK